MRNAHDHAGDAVYNADIRHWPETYKIYKIACEQRKQYDWVCLLQTSYGCGIVCNLTEHAAHDDLHGVSRGGFLEQLKTDDDAAYHVYLDIAAQDNFGTFLDCMVYGLKLDHKLTTF